MIKEVLNAIKSECAANNDDCISCPFNISDNWHDYCLFMGNIPHEGTTPDDWELNKIKWDPGSVHGFMSVRSVTTCDTCEQPCIMYEKGMKDCKESEDKK